MQAIIERVQLAFNLSNIIDLQVANNILYIAIGSTTVIRIDLDNPSKIHDIQLPKSKHPVVIDKIYSDPSGTHLIVQTQDSNYFYLNSTGLTFKPFKLGFQFDQLTWHRESAFLSHESTIYRFDTHTLKLDKRKESVLKVWTKEPINGLAVMHETLLVLTDSSLYRCPIDKTTLEKIKDVPADSSLVCNGSQYAILSPDTIINGNATISVKADRLLLSKYHLLVFKGEVLEIYNSVNCKMIFSLPIPLEIKGVCADSQFQTYWIFTESGLFEIKTENEAQGMWQIYVQDKQFEQALEIASATDKQLIYKEYGDHKFEQNHYLEAASYYGQSNAHIEGLALKFLELNLKPALILLFKSRLVNTKNIVQQTILSSWVAELMLQDELNEEFKEFIQAFGAKIHNPTVLTMLKAHGNSELLLWFTNFVRDYKFVVSYYIEKCNWDDALKVLREQEDEEMIYRYANVLLTHSPHATVESWMRIHKLNPLKLLPALLSYSSSYRGGYSDHQAIRYLRYQLAQADDGQVPAPLYNALLMIYAQTDSEEDLLAFLQNKASKFPDYNFSLRTCLENNKLRCAIYLYTVMSLYEEAVTLCLNQGLIDQAIEIVEQKVDNEQLRNYLWLEIARKIVATTGTSDALKLTEHLSVEDLLGLFPDFETLDHMVPEVVKALEASSNNLVAIHQEMKESINASDGMQQQIKSFKKLYALVEPGEPCQHCRFPLATRKFYMFPCQHGFHFDCIIGVLEQTSQRAAIEKARSAHQNPQQLNKALDPIASAECLICAESRIDSIDAPVSASW